MMTRPAPFLYVPGALIGLLNGANTGKMMVKLAD